MSQPTPYEPTHDFSVDIVPGDEGNALDEEFDDISLSISEVLRNLILLQRDDGALANGTVTPFSLSAETVAMLGDWTPRGAWLTATAYHEFDFVVSSGISYLALVDHVSGTFATDLAAGKWTAISKVDTLATAYTLTLLDDASASDWLTTLGLSAYFKTLVASANAAALRALLGSTTVGDAVFIAASSAAARSALGVYSTAEADAAAITKALIDAAGDLIYGTAADAVARLPIGTARQVLQVVAGLPGWAAPITVTAEQATTSGTSKTFAGIPAGVKRIKIMFVGFSTIGTNDVLCQLGDAGGVENTGYLGAGSILGATVATGRQTSGFVAIRAPLAASVIHGCINLDLQNASTFTWVMTASFSSSSADNSWISSGSKSLSAELTQVHVTSSDTFDAGAISISYE